MTVLTSRSNRCNKGVDDLALDAIDSSIFAYDIRQSGKDSTKFTPPTTFATWLSDPAVMDAIGAKGSFTLCSDRVGEQFISTGDSMSFTSISNFLATRD
jgi:carboxypeptidase D